MRTFTRTPSPAQTRAVGLLVVALASLVLASCQSAHDPEARRTDPYVEPGWPQGNRFFHEVSNQRVGTALPTIEGAEYLNDDELCASCHPAYTKHFAENVHRGDGCESCHGPGSKHVETRGKEPGLVLSFKGGDAFAKAELCLRCHEENACTEGSRWRTSKHAQCGVSCTDCHRGHYNVPEGTPATTEPDQSARLWGNRNIQLTSHAEAAQTPQGPAKDSTMGGKMPSLKGTSNSLGAIAPNLCFQCHSDYQEYRDIAGPHQICGPNGFNCTTCHDSHGTIREETRREMCLECHSDWSPTNAWHSSTHALHGVACTDCHNPHPRTEVPKFVNISHTNIRRPNRMPMSVQDPEACFRCHQKIFGLTSLPSHHPLKEGKMVCGDCHDGHGQLEKNLKAETVNLLCYRCHAEKQGPFALEHPPVTENCLICHEAHGTVANNLLRQPTTFLCLRCHDGHRSSHGNHQRNNIDERPWLRPAFYTDCTQCHEHIHGTDQRGSSVSASFDRF